MSQWIWNLRLELGQHLCATQMRLTEFAPAHPEVEPLLITEPTLEAPTAPSVQYGPPQWAHQSFTGGFPGSAFLPQSDGTLRCPANHLLYAQERRPERDGSYRLLYAARIGDCRACSLRSQCQESLTTTKPRRVSAVFWPVTLHQEGSPPPVLVWPDPPPKMPEAVPCHPVLWGDWPRCQLRRRWMQVMRTETVSLTRGAIPNADHQEAANPPIITRAQRARLPTLMGSAIGSQCLPCHRCLPHPHHPWSSRDLCQSLWF